MCPQKPAVCTNEESLTVSLACSLAALVVEQRFGQDALALPPSWTALVEFPAVPSEAAFALAPLLPLVFETLCPS